MTEKKTKIQNEIDEENLATDFENIITKLEEKGKEIDIMQYNELLGYQRKHFKKSS